MSGPFSIACAYKSNVDVEEWRNVRHLSRWLSPSPCCGVLLSLEYTC